MAKRKRKKNKTKGRDQLKGPRGFDLAEQPRVLAVSDLEFNQALQDAHVFGCGYGFDQIEGLSKPIPSIALVGDNQAAFERAFQHFARWGCEKDGDAVEIKIALKNNGTYEMWISPEVERSLYRTIPETQLVQPLVYNLAWIKSFDTTNPFLHKLRSYRTSALSPVLITAAVADQSARMPRPDQIRVIDRLPRLMKFDLKIYVQSETPDNPIFDHKQIQTMAPRTKQKMTPAAYREKRRKSIDVAFPVTRERLRRSGIVTHVRALPGYENVGESQVIQAAINLILSAELSKGDMHFGKIKGNLADIIWKHAASRFEIADGLTEVPQLDAQIIAKQVELDLKHVLSQEGISTAGKQFALLQSSFRRKGYVDD